MNLSALNPFQERKRVKVFGERNSGSIYLEWLLTHNLKVKLVDHWVLGWKHRLAPDPTELTSEVADLSFVVIAKNPYAWTLSQHRRPHHYEELRKLPFADFLRFPFGDYPHPVEMWNRKYQSYLALPTYVPQTAFVRYEDLIRSPEAELGKIAGQLGLAKGLQWFTDESRTISHTEGVKEKSFHSEYYLSEKWKKELNALDLAYINQKIDQQVMAKLGYPLL
jgi:Sulfotransferase domain